MTLHLYVRNNLEVNKNQSFRDRVPYSTQIKTEIAVQVGTANSSVFACSVIADIQLILYEMAAWYPS